LEPGKYRDNMEIITFFELLTLEKECEYQIRWIDGPVYYKKEKGDLSWNFCTDKEFAENVNSRNIIKWNPVESNK